MSLVIVNISDKPVYKVSGQCMQQNEGFFISAFSSWNDFIL